MFSPEGLLRKLFGARGGIVEAFTDLGSKGEGGHQIFFGALSVDVVC